MEPAPSLGARIRTLRERAGLQSQELAAHAGLDPSAMSNIEHGKRAVKTDELGRIASALSVSPLALLDEASLPARMPIAARADLDATMRGSAFSRLLALSELHSVLEKEDLETHPQLEDVPTVDHQAWRQSSAALADWAQTRLQVKDVGDDRLAALADAIEDRLGIDVLVEDHTGDALIGAAITDRSFPLIFVNASEPTPRALFTLAHELGHVLAGDGDAITLDDDLSGDNESERLANAFAAAYLLPEASIRRSIQEYGRSVESLARMLYNFGVSYESLVYRLHNLQLINAEGRDRLRSIGWSGLESQIERHDPDTALPADVRKSLLSRLGTRPERHPPGWLLARAVAGYRRGVISIRPLAGLLGMDPEQLLERGELFPSEAADILDRNYAPQSEGASDDELFEGSPI